MIDLSQKLIASLALASFLCGVFLGVIYEIARFIRCIITPFSKKRGARTVLAVITTFFSDLLFFLLFAACGILITFEMCGGVFRGIVYICMAVGLFIYRISIGSLTAVAVEWLANLLKLILKKIVDLLILPLHAINFLFVKLYGLTIGKIIGRIKERILIKRLAGIFLEEDHSVNELSAPHQEPCEKGYKKEGRVSFGGKKDIG